MNTGPLIDIHAHFHTERSSYVDWKTINQSRLDAGSKLGVTAHIASVLGTWGRYSPIYFPSPDDVTHANEGMVALTRKHPGLVYGYCVVNPNYTDHALAELERWLGEGLIGVKLAASRRANDRLLDPIAEIAAAQNAPILQHVWQGRRREWPGQEASDAVELAELASRHQDAHFILAHLGGGGDWGPSLRTLGGVPNIWVDLSGSGVDSGMLEAALDAVGSSRLLWGCDITMDTGLAKLRKLESMGLDSDNLKLIKSENARRLFGQGDFSL